MPKKSILQYLPTSAELRKHQVLRPVAHLLHVEEIWHLNRRSVAGAFFIGLFTAFLPLPGQMVIAAVIAIATRSNLPLSVALVWISNPFTIAPMFYFTYRLGAWLLDMQIEAAALDLSVGWLWNHFGIFGWPLLFGSLLCGWFTGITGFVLTHILWRLHTLRRWHTRRQIRRP